MAEIFVDPDGDGQGLHPTSLPRALRSARPGDEIILRAGRYTRPVTITRSGTKTAPIIIRSEEARLALMDGGQTPATDNGLGLELTKDSFAFIKCLNAKHVQLKGLQFRHCWPASVYIENSKGIRVSYCLGVGSRAFVFARQTGDQKTCKHILIEGCGWVQDPDFDMWEGRATWSEIKNDIGHGNKSHFNGAFFASNNIAVKMSIRHNTISHAFNAIGMEIDYGFVEGSQTKPDITRNRDVAIYGNSFAFIRDNAIEPEIGAQNWRVADNRVFNVHAAISLDKVAMRDVIVIGNTFLNNRQPGVQGTENQGGRIIKFIKPRHNEPPDKDRPRKDFWILFNSIQTRTTYTKKGITTFWRDYGNAFASLPKTHPRPGPVRRIMPGMDWSGAVLLHHFGDREKAFARVGGVGQHLVLLVAVSHDILAALQPHGRDRHHRLNALDINLVELLDKAEDGVELFGQRGQAVVLDLDPGELGHLGGSACVDRHGTLLMRQTGQ